MKLVTFRKTKETSAHFGAVLRDRVLSFEVLQGKTSKNSPFLNDMATYLNNLPESERAARELLGLAEAHFPDFNESEKLKFSEVRFLPPVPAPSALIDFALSPRHLENSLRTLLKYEYPWWSRWFVERVVRNGMKKRAKAGILPYYKGNHQSLIGDGEETSWPPYTCYLDIEPELAFVTGTRDAPIAGFTILNDWSARDVQWPEIVGLGLTRSKDFDRGNGLGPFLVTPEEIQNPRALKVSVRIGDRAVWQGSTSGYSHSPEEALQYLRSIFNPAPGTVIGMGTIADCCGLDRDEWIKPGDRIEITLEGLGILRQIVPQKALDFGLSPWRRR